MKFALIFILLIPGCSLLSISGQPKQDEPVNIIEDVLYDIVAFVEETAHMKELIFCSGVVVRGLVVTASHCVSTERQYKIMIKRDKFGDIREMFEPEVLYNNPKQDLAIVRARSHRFLFGRQLAPEAPSWGDPVVVIGHPYGLLWSVTTGVVSHPSRLGGSTNGQHWLHVSAPSVPGNSGGAVFNRYGEVVGIISFTALATPHIVGAVHLSEIQEAISAVEKGAANELDSRERR